MERNVKCNMGSANLIPSFKCFPLASGSVRLMSTQIRLWAAEKRSLPLSATVLFLRYQKSKKV